MEGTLYHKIGHHVHKHTFGQDPEQEKEANAYAARMMKRAHPTLSMILRPFARFFVRYCRR
jgi:hypothetical protein